MITINILKVWVNVVTWNNPPYIPIPVLKGNTYKLFHAIKLTNNKLLITILENKIDLSCLILTAFDISKNINNKISIRKRDDLNIQVQKHNI